MSDPNPDPQELYSLRRLLVRSFVRSWRRRPVSFYLLFAILAVAVLGVQFVYAQDDPKQLAFFLTINFVFCFVVMYRAIADAFDILRDHRRASRELYQATIGDKYFTRELGERVERERDAAGDRLDWPE